MDTNRFVLSQNIAHYREQLKSEADPARREVLAKLLADATAELARLLHTTAARDSRVTVAVPAAAKPMSSPM
jgi:hypothetical protein